MIYSLLLSAFLVICHVACVSGEENVYGTIRGILKLPDETPVNQTKLALNNGEQIAYSKLDGSFVFYNVPQGVHLLDVHSHVWHFSQIKVQLQPNSVDAPIKCIEYAYPGAPKQVIKHPLVLKAHATYQYFEARKGFNIMSILKNPMLIMMIFSVGMMVVMPKMMENMDPEERAQMQKQMQNQQDPTKMLSSLWNELSGGEEQQQQAVAGGAGTPKKKISSSGSRKKQ